MGSLDKFSLNNQIVLMRHDVRRAKLHTINKIVKEARSLKSRYGTEEQKVKYNRKHDRLMEEIKVIKKLKHDEVSKFLLANNEDLLVIINNPQNDIRKKVLAKISMNNFLKASLNEFKKKYPNWNNEVPFLLSLLGKKTKMKNKLGLIKEKDSVKSSESLSNNTKVNPSDFNKPIVVNTPGNNGFIVEDMKKKSSEEANDIQPKRHKKSKKNKVTVDVNNRTNEEDSESNRNSDSVLKTNNPVIKETTRENKEKLKVQKKETKVADPFFVTADNTEYMTVATSEKQVEALKNTNEYIKNDKFKTFQKYDNRHYEPNTYSKKFNSHFPVKPEFNRNKIVHNRKSFQQNGLTEKQNHEEKLHPSWEAKKKQSGLTQFAGKKIVFNDFD